MVSLAAIADDILVFAVLSILRLPLAAGCAEVAFLGFSAAAHAGRIMGIVDTPKIASHLATTARNACLVYALVLLRLRLQLGLRGRIGVLWIGGRGSSGRGRSSRRGVAIRCLGLSLGLGHGVAATASRPVLFCRSKPIHLRHGSVASEVLNSVYRQFAKGVVGMGWLAGNCGLRRLAAVCRGREVLLWIGEGWGATRILGNKSTDKPPIATSPLSTCYRFIRRVPAPAL